MSRFLNFIHGTLDCRIHTKASERFMNLCRSRGIYLQNIHGCDSHIQFTIGLKDYRKIRPVVRKCHSVPKIVRRRGLPFILHKNRRHKAFFIGIVLAMILLWIISGYIWDIEIEGNLTHTDEVLTEFLKEIQIQTGQRKSSVDTAFLEEELRLRYKDISWVSARIEGTVLKIQLKEAKVLTPDTDSDVTGDIVAWQDGRIESIVTRTGTAKVAPGDEIKAGELLIAGVVDVYNDDETIKNTHPVRADGDIYGQVIWHCMDYYPAWHIEKSYTGSSDYSVTLEAFGKRLCLGNTDIPQNSQTLGYEQIEQLNKYRLTKNFYLPFRIYITSLRAYTPQIVYYSDDEIQSMGHEQIEKKLESLKADGAEIIRSSLEAVRQGNHYVICGDIEMTVPIGKFVPHSQTPTAPEEK